MRAVIFLPTATAAGTVIILLAFVSPAVGQILPQGYPCEVIGSEVASNVTAENLNRCNNLNRLTCRNHLRGLRWPDIMGTCNNLKVNFRWGSTHEIFQRLVKRRPLEVIGYPPVFRIASTGRRLPDARKISSVVHRGKDRTHDHLTTLVMQFGQFLDHDITLTPEMNFCKGECGDSGETTEVDCCEFVNSTLVPKSCFPIRIPSGDPFFQQIFGSSQKPKCMDFKRSQPHPCEYTEGGIRDQFNLITSFVDASQVYGSENSVAISLREHRDGLMKNGGKVEGDELLPREPDPCSHNEDRGFKAGDIRVNENPGLQSLHTIWLREHNRLAKIIREQNPTLADDQTYFEARRWVMHQMQRVVYQEFLPVVVGREIMLEYDLYTDQKSIYRDTINPNIFNGFATAAFRFGHSLITSKFELMDTESNRHAQFLRNNFFNTTLVDNGKIDSLLRGMSVQHMEMGNNIVSEEVRNFLFKKAGHAFGGDLISRNIQRGRDHELGSYNSYRVNCGLKPLPGSFFHQPPTEIPMETWAKLSRVYTSPLDIELYPGGLSENPVLEGIIGPTFACIIGEQFRRLKYGDRYFYSHKNVHPIHRLCDDDFENIQKRTLRDIICENSNLKELQANPFLARDDNINNPFSCTQFNQFVPAGLRCAPTPNEYDWLFAASNQSGSDRNAEGGEPGVVAIVAGGYDGWSILSSVEVYSPNGTCQHLLPPLPEAAYGLTVAYVGDNTILACGGRTAAGISSNICYKYAGDHWETDSSLVMRQPRWLAAGADVRGDYYVTGGWGSPKTSEIFDKASKTWIQGPGLIGKRKRHCMVAYRDSLRIGNIVEQYNITTGQWRSLEGTIASRNKHSCVLLPDGDSILSVGGTLFSSIYKVSTGTALLDNDNILSRSYGGILNLNGRIIVIGGESHSNRVEEYDVGEGKFKLVDARIKVARSRFGYAAVPARIFNGLNGGCRP